MTDSQPIDLQHVQLMAPLPAQGINLDFWDTNWTMTNWLHGLDDGQLEYSSLQDLPMPLLANTAVGSGEWTQSPEDTALFPLSQPPALLTPVKRAANPLDGLAEIAQQMEQATTPGQYYVDGEPARLTKRRRRSHRTPQTQPTSAAAGFSLNVFPTSDEQLATSLTIPLQAYAEIGAEHARLCTQTNPIGAFDTCDLPPIGLFEHLLHLYVVRFDRLLPIIHRKHIFDTPHLTLRILAMSAIGSHYASEDCVSSTFVLSIQELVARMLEANLRNNQAPAIDHELAHIRLLHCISVAYSGDNRLSKQVRESNHLLVSVHRSAKQMLEELPALHRNNITLDEQWQLWRKRETAARLMHASWLVDCMWKYHFDLQPSLRTADANIPLPCSAKLWMASDAQRWSELLEAEQGSGQTLIKILGQLYVDRSSEMPTSDFANVLLVHGILRRSLEVEQYFSNPLSSWEPVASRQKSSELLPKEPLWLPSIPAFVKWQNSACDCVDVMHWHANAVIGQAAGMEHPPVLHLHLSRVILLAPYSNILSVAKAWVSGTPISASDRDILRRWVTEHQYKARLAIVHAGVTLWHVRRYSIDSFHEAPAIGLAILALWAFATFANHKHGAPRVSQAQSRRQSPNGDLDEPNDSIILLDRPTDDELVQRFIRKGRDMRTHMSRIGDLYDAGAALKVLLEGQRLLDELTCWAVRDRWYGLIRGLAESYASLDTAEAAIHGGAQVSAELQAM